MPGQIKLMLNNFWIHGDPAEFNATTADDAAVIARVRQAAAATESRGGGLHYRG